jgi:hypothetical protein
VIKRGSGHGYAERGHNNGIPIEQLVLAAQLLQPSLLLCEYSYAELPDAKRGFSDFFSFFYDEVLEEEL